MGGINEATEVARGISEQGFLGDDRSILLGVVGHDDGGLLQVVQIDYHQEHGGLRRIPERAYRKNERPE